MDWIIARLRSAIEREWKIVCIEVGANEVVCRLMKQVHINTESTRLNPQTDEAEKKRENIRAGNPIVSLREASLNLNAYL